MTFFVGQSARIAAEFRNSAGERVQPGAVSVRVLRPDGSELDPAPVPVQDRDADDTLIVGQFYAVFVVDVDGVWRWRVDGTSPAEAAMEGQFTVPFSHFG